MIYLDTNVVIWVSAKAVDQLSQTVSDIIDNSHSLFISPMVALELEYLYEIKKISKKPSAIIEHLAKGIGLQRCEKAFWDVATQAINCKWTREPFDRLITAHAAIDDNILLTRDKKNPKILQTCCLVITTRVQKTLPKCIGFP